MTFLQMLVIVGMTTGIGAGGCSLAGACVGVLKGAPVPGAIKGAKMGGVLGAVMGLAYVVLGMVFFVSPY